MEGLERRGGGEFGYQFLTRHINVMLDLQRMWVDVKYPNTLAMLLSLYYSTESSIHDTQFTEMRDHVRAIFHNAVV
jgi:hypothetical protein